MIEGAHFTRPQCLSPAESGSICLRLRKENKEGEDHPDIIGQDTLLEYTGRSFIFFFFILLFQRAPQQPQTTTTYSPPLKTTQKK